MSRLHGRVERLERYESARHGRWHGPTGLTIQDYFDTLTNVQEREAFVALVVDVHAIQQREDEADAAGRVIPARSAAEQARIDTFNRAFKSKNTVGAMNDRGAREQVNG